MQSQSGDKHDRQPPASLSGPRTLFGKTGKIAYSVVATLPDAVVADRYLRWLGEDHVAKVLAAGAENADVIVLDGAGPNRVEARYCFRTRQDFDRYLTEHAPRLRAEGRAAFPEPLVFERAVGEVLFSVPGDPGSTVF